MKDLPHDSAASHVSGESEYVDDRPRLADEVYVQVCYSQKAHARIRNLDLRQALAAPGVLAIFTAQDFFENQWGTIFKDQPLLASDKVSYVGEAIALVVAETDDAALAGRQLIRVEYEDLPATLSISAAKAGGHFIGSKRKIEKGQVDASLAAAPHRLQGEVVLQGADHFYLESQVTLVYPKEGGQLDVHTSSQHPTEVQHVIAHALGLSNKDVVCTVRRMGGGFGGKESQAAPFAAYAALAAHRLRRPARIVLCKDDDMVMTGKRNPFENSYRVGFDDEGHILALDVELFSDGGAYADLSTAIMERAMLHCDNAYYIPNFRAVGQVCRTNYHPHTAFRGFGGPKGVATIEYIIEEIAHHLRIDALDVRRRNCYGVSRMGSEASDVTPYGQVVQNNCLPRLFAQLEEECDYRARRRQIADKGGWFPERPATLHGLSLTAAKFGISFTTRFLNQANALVIVHRDGSIQVSTGATEMGQGVNARIAALVAAEFGLDRERVRVMPTSTDKNANTSPTAASSGTDLNGAAAVLAARKIKSRLSHLAAQVLRLPESRWARHTAAAGTEAEIGVVDGSVGPRANSGAEWTTGLASYHGIEFRDGQIFHAGEKTSRLSFPSLIDEAYHQRVNLSDYAHYKIPDLSFNKVTGQGQAFLYYTQGVAASEVSIDPYTGEVKVLRVDILMDLGRPIQKWLDLGQVTGAFVQGMGWVTTENLFYSDKGVLLSHSPSTYKIPNVQDTPRIFNAKLLSNDENFVNLRGTKAAGEPPLLLALSVWTAIHDALKVLPQYREVYPRLKLPATGERVLRAMYPHRFTPRA